MPIVLGSFTPNGILIQLKTKELLTHHRSCHANIVTKQRGMLLIFIVLYSKCELNMT